jgi:DNA-binding NarL/FixJ family response regulator
VEQDVFERVLPLLDRVHPQLRSSFVVSYSDNCIRLARYSEAEKPLAEAWSILVDNDLRLAFPTAYCVRALNSIGLRRYRYAELLLNAAEQATSSVRGSIPTQTRTLRAIIDLINADHVGDLSATIVDENTSKTWRGVSYAVDALKWACRGDIDTSLVYAARADGTTRSVEARTLTAFTRAIIAHRSETPEVKRALTEALQLAGTHQQWNQFVWAYRAYPELLALVASEPELSANVRPILLSAHDEQLATRYGIELPSVDRTRSLSDGRLSPREREVLRHVADGLSNKEIARKLFISEVTVKVHLRHIYKKLGVRNRTEAACYAVYSD